MTGGHSVLTFFELQPTPSAVATARERDRGRLAPGGHLLEQTQAPRAVPIDRNRIISGYQSFAVAIEHTVYPFTLVRARAGIDGLYDNLFAADKGHGEWALALVADKCDQHPGAHGKGTQDLGAVAIQFHGQLPRGTG